MEPADSWADTSAAAACNSSRGGEGADGKQGARGQREGGKLFKHGSQLQRHTEACQHPHPHTLVLLTPTITHGPTPTCRLRSLWAMSAVVVLAAASAGRPEARAASSEPSVA